VTPEGQPISRSPRSRVAWCLVSNQSVRLRDGFHRCFHRLCTEPVEGRGKTRQPDREAIRPVGETHRA
jgi:hypothetical protein